MRTNRAASADDYKLQSSFQTVRKTLLNHRDHDRLEKPLAYWVLPNDRRLPLAFLGRTLGDLLETPFEELSATPGIGQKKIGSLVKLLYRATKDEPPGTPFGMEELADVVGEAAETSDADLPEASEVGERRFEAELVSEGMWAEWRETVRRHGLGHETLGRLAPTLQSMPTVIWHTTLDTYDDLSLHEIRQLKTHGEKRVRAVLEVFHQIHTLLSQVEPSDQMHISLSPKFVPQVEAWVSRRLRNSTPLAVEEVRQELALPLLSQIQTDAGRTVARLARERIGLDGDTVSVRVQARAMGVTRTRIYQLLDECAKVMEVRWQDGGCRLQALAERYGLLATLDQEPVIRLFHRVRSLFFPPRFASNE